MLIRKGPDKPLDAPSSYRPICILDTPGKLLQRLEAHLDTHGGWRRAGNQYGFRRGISTETAVEKVLSIATQAASCTGWKDLYILVTSEYLVEMLHSWLTDKVLLTEEELAPRQITCGVPQGSVLELTLWNVAYDSLPRLDVPSGVHLVGFADDLAVVCVARTEQLL